jgi:DNA-binding MarR family transcriptional regulator/GNAT superfamily N-acetyltransferase
MRTVAVEPASDSIAAVRAFNRFYTRWVGALDEGLLRTRHSLAEARVLFELGRRDSMEVAELRRTLDVDAGYLSRMLGRLEDEGLVARERSAADARRQLARLTKSGRAEFRLLDRRSAKRVGASLGSLDRSQRERLVAAMGTIHRVLEPSAASRVDLRPPGRGDFGWIVERHGALYAEEFGFDERFEALVARIVADFAADYDPRREAAFVADVDGVRAGCVLCVRRNDAVAQLRLLLVEPWARGIGLGARLVDECLRFARAAGYVEIALWTQDVLRAAHRIYERAGFELVESEPHDDFGPSIAGEHWSRPL